MGFGAHDMGGDGDGGLRDLIVKIHSSRTHASTDSILEYHIEVAPMQLVCLASAGIHRFRKPADTTYDVLPSESEDESGSRDPDVGDVSRRRKKRSAGLPPVPDSHLRMWMPACMVRSALPELVERYEAGLKAKRTKKSKGGGSSPPQKTHVHTALPVCSLHHPRLPKSINKCPTQEDYILDITTSDNDSDDAPGPFEQENPPLSSPSKVLQRLDGNLCSVPLPPSVPSPPTHKRPVPTSSLQPFPIAFKGEGSSDDVFGDDNSKYSLETPFTFCATLHPTSPQRWQLQHRPFPSPLPPVKRARKGGSDEGRVPHTEMSIISISSSDSDDSSDGLGLAPSLVARSRTVSQKVATTSQDVYHEVIDLT